MQIVFAGCCPTDGTKLAPHNPTLLLTKGFSSLPAMANLVPGSYLFLPFAAELDRYVQRTESPLNGLDCSVFD